jgi:hypothetical protein
MSREVNDPLDELATGGRRFRGTLQGDYKPTESGDPMADVLARVYALILSWPVTEMPESPREGTTE